MTRHPKLWADYRGGHAHGTQGLTQPVTDASGWAADAAHQPDLSYVPYLLTGSRYRLDQLQAQACDSLIKQWPESRQEGKGLVVSGIEQVRGQGWSLRNIVEAAYISPDDSPLKPYFNALLARNIDHLLQQTRTPQQSEAHGWFPGQGYKDGAIAPWQQDYLASSTTLAALQGVPGARDIVAWQANFLVRRFLSETQGFSPFNAFAYTLVVSRPDTRVPLRTWREIAEASAALGLPVGGTTWPKGVEGYGQSAMGVLAEIITVTGSPDAQHAFDWMRTHFPLASPAAMRGNPVWNMVPRRPAEDRAKGRSGPR